ncbi:uncharacterized protein LOC142168367 [Nicotiana tabacum]|uniref:Uncharacterized protein LOC142168367 n=1 Tax=Nicotiana tabacum TaxID=4097 RepID=A0AC58SJI2_TOBAC
MTEIESENEGQTINIENMQQTIGITEKLVETLNSFSSHEFDDSENELLDFNPMLDKGVTGKQRVEGGRERISVEDYIYELKRTNPGSLIHVKLTENEIANRSYIFHRIYICFAARKEGFKASCRKIVGVDSCWLKGPMYGTQLSIEVGLDANNNIFPIAYAVVEKETRDTWSWFLNYLSIDLEIDDYGGWTFMSDKQKCLLEAFIFGLLQAFNDVLPFVSHRFCVRHLYDNFRRTGFSGFSLRNAFWAAAKSMMVKFFHDRMSDLLNLDANVVSWLNDKPPSEWSRSHFNPNAKCDILLNIMCESFNSMILEARDKPIIILLEKSRYILMAWIQANRDKGEKWNLSDVCPRIKDILHKNELAAATFIP